jgi:general secretion pathway protein G
VRRRRGFTLVDVLVTVIIVGLLASIMLPKFQYAQMDARRSARDTLLQIYNNAVGRFQTDTDLFPANLAGLAAEAAPANGLTQSGTLTPLPSTLWRGPYVSGIQNDPVTGEAFGYVTSGPEIGTVTAPSESGPAEVP